MFSPKTIPASQKSSNEKWFYSPVAQSWLEKNHAVQHFSFGPNLATVFSTLLMAPIGTAAAMTAGLPWLTTLAFVGPAIAVHSIVYILRKPWKRINQLTSEALYSWLLNKNILISNPKTLGSIVQQMEPREFNSDEKEHIRFEDDNGQAYTLHKDYWDYAWQVKETKTIPSIDVAKPKTKKTANVKKAQPRNTKQLTWNNELQTKYFKLEEQFAAFQDQKLTPEEQHAVERISRDLDELVTTTEALRQIDQPTIDDIKRLHRILNGLEKELSQLNKKTADSIRKSLEAQENFINDRSIPTQKYLEIN